MKYFFVLFFVCINLIACQKPLPSRHYLLTHPHALKDNVIYCQNSSEKTQGEVKQCEVVLEAAASFMALFEEQQSSPEQFGQKIMQTEFQVTEALQKKLNAKHDLKSALDSSDESKIAAAKLNYSEAAKDYDERKTRLQILLAVVSLSSPE